MAPQGRSNIGNMIALGGGILATLTFFLFPYISLGIFGSYTAVQLAQGVFGSSTPALWLEVLIAGVVSVLAAVSWYTRNASAILSLIIIAVSAITLLGLGAIYVMQSQQ